MNRIQIFLLDSLRASLQRQAVTNCPDFTPAEWDQLFALAQSHHVLPLVFEAVCRLPELKNSPVRRQVIGQVMLQTQKTAEFLKVLEALRSGGVTPLVVKGLICRSLYPLPDHRPSSDEDVLIPLEQSGCCHRILTELGLKTTVEGDRFETDYEIPYRQESGPLYIELHRHLFPPESEAYGDLNRFFEQAQVRSVTETIDGVSVPTLGYTDHLFFLICHAFKHFLHSGFGIRQVCDITLYANAYGSRIDWAQVLENCRRIRADQFAAALFQIGSNHLAFDPEKAAYPQLWREIRVDEIPMLEDLLAGGIYGAADMSRKHSSSITLDAVTAQKQGRKKRSAVLTSLFPPVADLVGRHPYLKKYPWLLPIAWIGRLWNYFLETRRASDNNAADALKIGSERVELMKQYGILE